MLVLVSFWLAADVKVPVFLLQEVAHVTEKNCVKEKRMFDYFHQP